MGTRENHSHRSTHGSPCKLPVDTLVEYEDGMCEDEEEDILHMFLMDWMSGVVLRAELVP